MKGGTIRAEATGPFFLIRLGGLEDFEFEEAMQLLIRAGARNGGGSRVFRVDTPLAASQLMALGDLEDFGSSAKLTIAPGSDGDEEVRVDPGAPEPDLSGLGNTDMWWYANGYPTSRR